MKEEILKVSLPKYKQSQKPMNNINKLDDLEEMKKKWSWNHLIFQN